MHVMSVLSQENSVKVWEARAKICHMGRFIYTLYKQKPAVTASVGRVYCTGKKKIIP